MSPFIESILMVGMVAALSIPGGALAQPSTGP